MSAALVQNVKLTKAGGKVNACCHLRVGEAVALRVSDLDLGERHGRVIVRQGKGNKYRVVPVTVEARKALREWLAERDKKFPGSEWLFPNKKGGHISTRYAEQVIGELARRANIECTPHTLRHTCATNMLRTGADLVTVAQVLGHENLNTTAVYTRPDEKTMAEAVEKGEI